IQTAIELASEACAQLGLKRQRVGVCGLNPHAGEGGELGTEELTTIAPAIEKARANGIDVAGPLAADTLFHQHYRGDFDAVVAMYHDQGLAPMKMVAFDSGVNWTLGLPFVRTSPDHGTAYDLVGKNQANPSSMVSAIQLACQIARSKK
ncbi:MAG TPA: 4-hydroxythreonine-4-phosphate dehydrogenase PdxA, partial [Verrucomicrobiae bacterium]